MLPPPAPAMTAAFHAGYYGYGCLAPLSPGGNLPVNQRM